MQQLKWGDSDNDGLPGWWESQYGLDDSNASDANSDEDGDQLSASQEYTLRTDPSQSDTDQDGLSDSDEVNTTNTSPTNADSDADGLSDGDEVNTHSTNPLSVDSDEDGLNDAEEINEHQSNPLSTDTDGDGIDDYWGSEQWLVAYRG